MEIWSVERINEWYAKIPWQVGFNYVPSTAVNSTEMWQKATFDEKTIRRELAWAKEFGYNSVRVFLQFIVWEKEREDFLKTFETFLSIAAENGMSVLPILFDDCAFGPGCDPFYGEQLPPIEGLHNGRWTPSPGFQNADDPSRQAILRSYVHAIVSAHKDDDRILAWDVYNEPGNTQRGNRALPLLRNVFSWTRECEPSQPLTASPWQTGIYDSTYHAMRELSDILSFHSYDQLEVTVNKWIKPFEAFDRPMFVTEWLCRQRENTFESHLPLWAEKKICCWQWGFAVGKTQTNLWWDSRDPNPEIWQHDVVRADGTPFDSAESKFLKEMKEKYR